MTDRSQNDAFPNEPFGLANVCPTGLALDDRQVPRRGMALYESDDSVESWTRGAQMSILPLPKVTDKNVCPTALKARCFPPRLLRQRGMSRRTSQRNRQKNSDRSRQGGQDHRRDGWFAFKPSRRKEKPSDISHLTI